MEIRKFVCDQLKDCHDLSKLTLNVLKGRYLEHTDQESLSPEDKLMMKKVVKEELMKMQDDQGDEGSVSDPMPRQVKRKRREESVEETQGKEGGSRAKRSRVRHSSAESMDSGIDRVETEQEQVNEEEDCEKSGEDAVPNNTSKKMNKKSKGVRKGQNDAGSSDGEEEEKRGSKGGRQPKRGGEVERQKEDVKCDENDGNAGSDSDGGSSGDGEDMEGEVRKETSLKSAVEDPDASSSPSEEDEPEKKSKPQPAQRKKKTVKKSGIEGASGNAGRVSDDESGDEARDTEDKVGKETSLKSAMEDSDSSSLPSLDDEPEKKSKPQPAQKRKKTVKKSSTEGASRKAGRVSDDGSSDDEDTEGKVRKETSHKSTMDDSDSSSLPSLDEEPEEKSEPRQAKKKSKTVKKSEGASEGAREEKDEKAVTRLKRYIALCGARKNYKKLFEGCSSVRSKVKVLKKELEDLGVHGQPSIEKCKRARLKREEAQELADLDVSNIITTSGRPKRNAPSALHHQVSTPSASYKRAVNSSSGSDEDSHADRGKKRVTDWGNLQGIISDDGDGE